MVDQPSSSELDLRSYRGIWLEVSQEYKRPHFFLKTNFLALEGWDFVAFSFFVKAKECRLAGLKSIFPKTLDSYQDQALPISLIGNKGCLEIKSSAFKGTMQVIPLSGGTNFWGADFLVSYHLSAKQASYQWDILF